MLHDHLKSFFVLALALFMSCTLKAATRHDDGLRSGSGSVWRGVASFYGGSFIGQKTASGRVFRGTAMTAAHRTLPFGTVLKVTDLNTRRSVMVVVNDRGPFVSGREIDLSVGAASRIGMRSRGIAPVRIERCQ